MKVLLHLLCLTFSIDLSYEVYATLHESGADETLIRFSLGTDYDCDSGGADVTQT